VKVSGLTVAAYTETVADAGPESRVMLRSVVL